MKIIIFLATFVLNIEDVNDNSPKFKEPFYKFSIPENSKYGVKIGTIRADDLDKNKTITYSIANSLEQNNFIYLDSVHGDLIVANKIDREENDWLNLTVSVKIWKL